MTNISLVKAILMPFSLIYGFIISVRNIFYDSGILKSSKFSVPVISIGNLSIGGAGKTPHVEYLISLLSQYINVSVLSRGYNRESSGFKFVNPSHTAKQVGDESLMYARKYADIVVAVGENRSLAIPQIVGSYPSTQSIILDDAFQHRSVLPFINILLTQYELPFTKDFLMPSGRLREWRTSYERADIIIVTKCPNEVTLNTKDSIIKDINLQPHQSIFFTKYVYEYPYNFYTPHQRLQMSKDHDAIVISAIANTQYLNYYLNDQLGSYYPVEYEDHHNFTDYDVDYMIQIFNKREKTQKYILTTEKDAVRLDPYRSKLYNARIPVYVLPLKVAFMFDEQPNFDELIKNRLMEFTV